MRIFGRYIVVFTLLIVATAHTTFAVDLEYIRKNYPLSTKDKSLCVSMIAQLSKKIESDVHLAYLGAFQAIMANHVFSPLEKINTFNQGKKNIDKAVLQAPLNPEIRFIRLSIQKNTPAFLGYNKQIAEDEAFLKEKINTLSSVELKKQITSLINSK